MTVWGAWGTMFLNNFLYISCNIFDVTIVDFTFQVDKQILIVTVLFSCSRDDESTVKAAAVRALAICVLYPSLREVSQLLFDFHLLMCSFVRILVSSLIPPKRYTGIYRRTAFRCG